MEARFGAQIQRFYGDFGKRPVEWDLNDWKWDGDLFIASPINSVPSKEFFPLASGIPASNSSSSCSEEVDLGIGRGKREFEKRTRAALAENEDDDDDAATLSLKLGGRQQLEATTTGKKFKSGSNRAVCQVEGCAADLTNAKDYHRRHKVCEMHSKATKALVGNVMQRFCQQCSRFHILQEFDDGKRSCRRRLAGHNKRRRKTNPAAAAVAAANGNPLNDDQTSSFLLISLLRTLSNMHSNRSDEGSDQGLVSHLLRSLVNLPGQHGVTPGVVSALLSSGSQGPPTAFNQHSTVSELSPQQLHEDDARGAVVKISSSPKPSVQNSPPASSEVRQSPPAQIKMNNFDLNDIYIDSDDGVDDMDRLPAPADNATTSLDCPSWVQQDSHQSSPPQMSGNSDSVSGQSPSSSSGDAQSRTDRIVFKLFGKVPNDFPLVMRAQILDWLSHSPTDIESYIRPGCVVLTIYLRQADAVWEQLCCDLSSSLSRLLDVTDDTFWTSGWICIRVQNQIAFVYDGQVVIESSLPIRSIVNSKILSVKPIAVSASERVQFSVKGINMYQPSTRLLCALEGKYLVQEATHELLDTVDPTEENDELQFINLSCSIPELTGRGFVEVEDNGLSSSFFPFIVAEEDVCSEIRMLEGTLEFTEDDTDVVSGSLVARNQAMEFIHEMGWLLHRSQLKSRLGQSDPNTEHFALKRFIWLMEFSMDHDWCAVVRKLLDVLFDGTVGVGEHPTADHALSDMGLLHRAVRRNSRPLVELLLKYVPGRYSEKPEPECGTVVGGGHEIFLFRPDASGPAGLTPLHIAAGKDGSEAVLDALTDDPGMVGMEAWKTIRDSTGFTPEDYARLRGHYSYIHMVQRKNNKRSGAGHVVLDIPDVPSEGNVKEKENNELSAGFEIGGPITRSNLQSCKLCDKKMVYGRGSRSLAYRPAMLSMVAVAAVCVCVALLFKSSPEVLYVFQPFRWELLDFGTI